MARRASRSLSLGNSKNPACHTEITARGFAGAPPYLPTPRGRLKVCAEGQAGAGAKT
jgi:hypothetical protein